MDYLSMTYLIVHWSTVLWLNSDFISRCKNGQSLYEVAVSQRVFGCSLLIHSNKKLTQFSVAWSLLATPLVQTFQRKFD